MSSLTVNLRKIAFFLLFWHAGHVHSVFDGFQPYVRYPTLGIPEGIAEGDFNHTGNSSLAVANLYDNTVSILLNNGDGTFQPQQAYSTEMGPIAVAVGDFTGNGILDLAIANYNSNSVSILLGNGDGSFQPQLSYATGNNPMDIAVGDFTGNGILDLAITNFSDNTVSILIGNGDGTFQTQQNYSTGNGPLSIVVGKFTGRNLGLAVTNFNDDTVSVLLGNGDGSFQNQATYQTGSQPFGITAGVFNHSANLDLAVTNSNDDTVGIFLGKGDGSFQNQIAYPTGNTPAGIVAADFSGNGILDLAVANFNGDNGGISFGNVGILLGNGDGTFQNQLTYPAGEAPKNIVAADFDADGKLDVAVTNFDGDTVSVLLQKLTTSTTLMASPNPSIVGQTIVLTATVSSSSATGTVTFYDGATLIGAASVSNGSAVFSTPLLLFGSHSITANYSGDMHYVASTSSPVTLMINKVFPPNEIFPPTHLKGVQKRKGCGSEVRYENIVTWQGPSEGNPPVNYSIYRDPSLKKLVGVVPAQQHLVFKEAVRKYNRNYYYYIVAIDQDGNASVPARIVIKRKKCH